MKDENQTMLSFSHAAVGYGEKAVLPRCKLSGEKRRVRGADRVKWNGKIHSDQMCVRPASSDIAERLRSAGKTAES